MGDGINDSPPLKQSDVGISVDTAVDIAKETADIILLEKDLNVLEKGVIIGRKTFTNILKYIKMATSGNFGNMLSIIIASLALPFLPNDFAQIGMPFNNVDTEYLLNPKKWNTSEIKKNMFIFGTISTIFDLLCFLALWFIMKFNTTEKSTLFQTSWFAYGIISQTVIIHLMRTSKIPFIQSKPSKQLIISTMSIIILTLIICFTNIAIIFDLQRLPVEYGIVIVILMMLYAIAIQAYKKIQNMNK